MLTLFQLKNSNVHAEIQEYTTKCQSKIDWLRKRIKEEEERANSYQLEAAKKEISNAADRLNKLREQLLKTRCTLTNFSTQRVLRPTDEFDWDEHNLTEDMYEQRETQLHEEVDKAYQEWKDLKPKTVDLAFDVEWNRHLSPARRARIAEIEGMLKELA